MSRSRVSRIDLPLSRLSSTASRRECFWTARARAYKWRARAWPDSADQVGNSLRAAATAASTSAWPAWVTRASRAVVAGLMTSNPASLFPSAQRPPMNSPNAPSCRAIHSSAGLSLSGAGPYAIVSKTSETVVMSHHGMVVGCRVAPGHEVLELPLDVGEEDHLHVGWAARLPEGPHLVIQCLPRAGQGVRARDHHVDLLGAGGNRGL